MGAPETIRVSVNGRERELAAGTTVAGLVDALGFDRRFLVVEWNGEPRALRDCLDRTLAPGDRLELVRPVAGG